MSFVAPDGQSFDDLKAYRVYVFENYFRFKGHEGDTLRKPPGSVNGQEFHLEDLEECTVEVLDVLDRAVVANLKNCNVFLGPTQNTVFIRKCEDCSFTVAAKEIRLVASSNCTVRGFSPHPVQLDDCHHIALGDFNGGYSGLTRHFQQAGLVPVPGQSIKVSDASSNDMELPKPHFTIVPNAEQAATVWMVELPNANGAPENPLFPSGVEPAEPPPCLDSVPDLDVLNGGATNVREPQSKASIPPPDPPIPVGDAFQKLEKEFNERVERLDAEQEEKKNEMREKADEEIESHYEERTNANAIRYKSNRETEEVLIKQLDEEATSESSWARVLSLIDVNRAEKEEDRRGRLRRLLLQLKNA